MVRNKIVRVLIDEPLLQALDSFAQAHGETRSRLIREARQRFIHSAEDQRSDHAYGTAYRRVPEEPTLGLAQEAMLREVLKEERW